MSQSRARLALRRTLLALKTALGAAWLEIDRDRVGLRRNGQLWVDVLEFRARILQANKPSPQDTHEEAATEAALAEAVAFYRGDFLAGFTLRDSANFDEWQFFQTESLRRDCAGALERLVHAHANQADYEAAITHARRWLALDPLHEPAHCALISLYARAGQQSAALRQYEECARLFHEELGAPPAEETTALYEAIRTRRWPEKMPPADDDVTLSLPHPLLLSPRHNLPPQPTSFIGRATELTRIAALLADPACRLLTLIGPGGVGKTRLAIQAALGQADAFEHGVRFVTLAPWALPTCLPRQS
jgi:DNA-binding SARP family transcriptional activator